jgi:hypothetical protein
MNDLLRKNNDQPTNIDVSNKIPDNYSYIDIYKS